jgi:hypothetical protein
VNDLHIFPGSLYPAFALLLEAVQDEDSLFELDGVDGPVRPSGIVFDDLQNTSASEALHRLCCVVLLAVLRKVQGVAEELPHGDRQVHQVSLAAPDPDQRLFGGKHIISIPEQV